MDDKRPQLGLITVEQDWCSIRSGSQHQVTHLPADATFAAPAGQPSGWSKVSKKTPPGTRPLQVSNCHHLWGTLVAILKWTSPCQPPTPQTHWRWFLTCDRADLLPHLLEISSYAQNHDHSVSSNSITNLNFIKYTRNFSSPPPTAHINSECYPMQHKEGGFVGKAQQQTAGAMVGCF